MRPTAGSSTAPSWPRRPAMPEGVQQRSRKLVHSLHWWLHRPSRHSRQDFMNYVTVHIRKAKVAARVTVRQLLVVETQQVQEGGVQVVDVDGILHGTEAELVGGAVDLSALDAAAGHPDREAVRVVIASVDLPALRIQLDRGRAPELATPENQRLVEEAALRQILEERADGPVALASEPAMLTLDIAVAVPRLHRAVPDLDKANPLLDEPPSNQRLSAVQRVPVHLPDAGRLSANVECVDRFQLHS